MKNIRTLAWTTVGVIALSLIFALASDRTSVSVETDKKTGRSIQYTEDGDRGEFVLSVNDLDLQAAWDGEFEIDPSGTDIVGLEHWLKITIDESGVEKKALFKNTGDELIRRLYIDGEKQSVTPESDAEIAMLLQRFLRTSGLMADERVLSILESGGNDAAIAEIAALEGDYAVRRYVHALLEHGDLSRDDLLFLIGEIEDIDSDHEKSRAIVAILGNDKLRTEDALLLNAATSSIDSDHELRKLVEAFAEAGLADETAPMMATLIGRIGSDHDRVRATKKLLEDSALQDGNAAIILEVATEKIGSDHDLRTLLTSTVDRFQADQRQRDAWLKGLESIGSDHDRRNVIVAAAEHGDLKNDNWRELIAATEAISSDLEKRKALMGIAENMPYDDRLYANYRKAATGIDSEHERTRTLSALDD